MQQINNLREEENVCLHPLTAKFRKMQLDEQGVDYGYRYGVRIDSQGRKYEFNQSVWDCPHCNVSSQSFAEFVRHLNKEHKIGVNIDDKKADSIMKMRVFDNAGVKYTKEGNMWICQEDGCNSFTGKFNEFIGHLERKHNYRYKSDAVEIGILMKRFDVDTKVQEKIDVFYDHGLPIHYERSNIKRNYARWTCGKCGQRFNSSSSLAQHANDKHGMNIDVSFFTINGNKKEEKSMSKDRKMGTVRLDTSLETSALPSSIVPKNERSVSRTIEMYEKPIQLVPEKVSEKPIQLVPEKVSEITRVPNKVSKPSKPSRIQYDDEDLVEVTGEHMTDHTKPRYNALRDAQAKFYIKTFRDPKGYYLTRWFCKEECCKGERFTHHKVFIDHLEKVHGYSRGDDYEIIRPARLFKDDAMVVEAGAGTQVEQVVPTPSVFGHYGVKVAQQPSDVLEQTQEPEVVTPKVVTVKKHEVENMVCLSCLSEMDEVMKDTYVCRGCNAGVKIVRK